MYLAIFEDSKKLNIAQRVHNAIDAYKARYSRAPSIVLMNDADFAALNAGDVDGITVDGRSHIGRNNYWAGLVP